MDKDKIEELLEARKLADRELEKLRTAVTILFSDIKGSTQYFERRGDAEGLAMVQRHNKMLIPVIESENGRVVKTIGDSIMACFYDPVCAVRAAIGMQRRLEEDRLDESEEEQIHIRIGLHTGLGLEKDGDVYGDVVNAAARVEHQAQADQILITDVLLDAAKAAGAQCAKLGRAEMKGKDEPFDVYAVAWSESAGDQLIEELEAQFERKLKDARRQFEELDGEFDAAREQWRTERRRLTSEIEELEDAVEQSKQGARLQASDDLQAEIRFQLQEAVQSRHQVEQELVSMQAKWELERNNLKAQIAAMQGAALESMERSNNPTRLALAVREQVDARLKQAREDWQLEWESERRRLNAEIERLKKAGNIDEKKEAARRALLQKLGKLPAGAAAVKTAEQWKQEFEEAGIKWDAEREQLNLKLRRLERELQRGKDELRSEIYQEMRAQYEPKLAQAEMDGKRMQEELDAANAHLAEERQRFAARIDQLESAIPEAQDAVRQQVTAELQSDFETKIEELTRLKSRNERRFQDAAEESEVELRRLRKQVARLEEELREVREDSFRARRAGAQPSAEED